MGQDVPAFFSGSPYGETRVLGELLGSSVFADISISSTARHMITRIAMPCLSKEVQDGEPLAR